VTGARGPVKPGAVLALPLSVPSVLIANIKPEHSIIAEYIE